MENNETQISNARTFAIVAVVLFAILLIFVVTYGRSGSKQATSNIATITESMASTTDTMATGTVKTGTNTTVTTPPANAAAYTWTNSSSWSLTPSENVTGGFETKLSFAIKGASPDRVCATIQSDTAVYKDAEGTYAIIRNSKFFYDSAYTLPKDGNLYQAKVCFDKPLNPEVLTVTFVSKPTVIKASLIASK